MDTPTQLDPVRIAPDTFVLPAYFPIPGLGVLPMSAFLIRGAEPVLVDTGCGVLRDAFVQRLATVIDPADPRWVWLTHADPDHLGALEAVLAAAPRARVVTNFVGAGKIGLTRPLPPERVFLLNPGQRLEVGDRSLVALRPPVYDAPETMAAFDPRTRTLFSADCFGCLMPAPVETAAALPDATLRENMLTWAGVDAPWLEHIEAGGLSASLGAVERLAPEIVLGAHLPPAVGMVDTLLRNLAGARGQPPFVGPDQAAVEAMLAAGLRAVWLDASLVGHGALGYGAPGSGGRVWARPPARRSSRAPEPMDDRSTVATLADAELGRRIADAPDGAARAEERELYQRFARRVRLYGLRHLGGEDAAADLVQQVMLVTLQKLRGGEVRDLDRLGSFVLGVARMLTRQRYRGARRETPLTETHRELPDAPAPTPDAFAGDRLAGCLKGLSERERSVVVLTFYGEQTSAEIADALGLRVGNVRVIRHRAIGRLRTCLGLDEEDVS